MPQSLADDYIEHIYVMGASPAPSLQETLKFQDASNALRQLQEMLEGSYKKSSGVVDGFVAGRDYTFSARYDTGGADAQLDLLEAQLEMGDLQYRMDGLLELSGEWGTNELLQGRDPVEEEEDEEQASRSLPTPGASLVEQLQMDQPLMQVIANKHKRGYYRCTHCPQTFSNIFDYAAHMDEFDIKREFKCPFALCPWKILGLPRRPDLRRHCAIQHKHELPDDLKQTLNLNDETYPALKCPHQYCDKVFHRRDAYNRHISIVHEKLGSRFNKRLFQILAECPYDKETDRHAFVKNRMRSRKTNCNNKKTTTAQQ
ncbi:hypothetical protein HG537_0E01050 [Torulaspora globosa]|uniref:C2H2-type domain-containing protein n=1 Tax=Torulaspora globosa TaxID=48254 RepID=A0A7H9HWJ8_9SACH|nr:hypothetical protein HG537_0E01050 [Torulaspora sp. CBS 2947]